MGLLDAYEKKLGAAPTITSLTPSLASPQAEETKIDFICVASDIDLDSLFYRFFLTGPGTASKKKLVQDWSHNNSWQWQPLAGDVGTSSIEVQVRDGLHAAEGSYDDTESVSYTITAAAGTGTAPTITSLTPSLASPQVEETKIDFICVASDADSDQIFYRFFLTGPGTASKKKLVQDWGHHNSWQWQPQDGDVGTSSIEVQVRDGLHAAEGSYDATTSISYTVTTSIGAIPAIVSLTPELASPQPPGTEMMIICAATSSDGSEILYKFWHQLPGGAWIDVSSWTTQNFVRWKPTMRESGTNAWKVEIIDQKHAGRGSYDATASISFTVTP